MSNQTPDAPPPVTAPAPAPSAPAPPALPTAVPSWLRSRLQWGFTHWRSSIGSLGCAAELVVFFAPRLHITLPAWTVDVHAVFLMLVAYGLINAADAKKVQELEGSLAQARAQPRP